MAFGSGFLAAAIMVIVQRKKLNNFTCPECGKKLDPDWSNSDAIVSKLKLKCNECGQAFETDFESTGAF